MRQRYHECRLVTISSAQQCSVRYALLIAFRVGDPFRQASQITPVMQCKCYARKWGQTETPKDRMTDGHLHVVHAAVVVGPIVEAAVVYKTQLHIVEVVLRMLPRLNIGPANEDLLVVYGPSDSGAHAEDGRKLFDEGNSRIESDPRGSDGEDRYHGRGPETRRR